MRANLWARALVTLCVCAQLALATETIDGANPPNPAKFAWNAGTKTATLLVDLTEPVVITGAGVTLDGGGHSITGPGAGTDTGIDVQKCVGVTVKNCTVRAWSIGIRVWGTSTAVATDAVVLGNLVEDNVAQGIAIQAYAERVRIQGNIVLRTLNAANNSAMAIRSDVDDAQILGNTVNDNNFGIFVHGAARVLIKDNDADSNPGPSGNSATGIHLQNCTDCRVEHNSAVDGSWIKTTGCSGTEVVRNTADKIQLILDDHSLVETNTVDAPLAAIGIEVTGGNGHVIRSNTANNRFSPSGFRAPGILVNSSNGNLIENNTTNGNEEGIVLSGVDTSTVRGNTAAGNTNGYGIHVQSGSDDVVIENNTVTDGPTIGIRYADGAVATIRGNTVSGNGSAGISVARSSDVVVESNTASNNAAGIGVGGTACIVRNNTSNNNAVDGYGLGGEDGLFENNAGTGNGLRGLDISGFRHVVRNNTFVGSGIRESNGGGALTADNTIENNTVTDSVGIGLDIWGVRTLVRGNTATGSASTGLRIHAADNTIENNLLQNGSSNGLELRAGFVNPAPGGHTITGNRVRNNTGLSIWIPSSTGSLIYNNEFNSADTVAGSSTTFANTWNVPQQAGPNIVGGPYIGGNFWGKTDGTGHSQTCTDANGDGFCDDPFTVRAPDNVDNLPLVLNTPPSCNPSGAGTYQLGSPITLGGTVADNEGDLVTYTWREGATILSTGSVQAPVGGGPAALPDLTVSLGLGMHTIELVVDDGHVLDPVVCEILVEVIDTTDPCLHPVSDCSMLWPPDHRMVTCTIQANASDNDGLPPALGVSVTSNEPDDGLGDGDTPDDIQHVHVDDTTGTITVDLRAERGGVGSGRVYTITITATDSAGNTSMTSLTILVPRSKGQGGN